VMGMGVLTLARWRRRHSRGPSSGS
jgi:hypothetical protein